MNRSEIKDGLFLFGWISGTLFENIIAGKNIAGSLINGLKNSVWKGCNWPKDTYYCKG